MKTNAVRALDRLEIAYELRSYDVDPEHLDAETVADKIRMPADQVFKTLVARGDRNGVCLAVIPGSLQLNPKALARLSGSSRCRFGSPDSQRQRAVRGAARRSASGRSTASPIQASAAASRCAMPAARADPSARVRRR